MAPHLPSNKENGGRVQVSISLSQKEVYKTWQLTYLLLVPFGINNIRLRHKLFTKWTLKDKLADAVGPYQRETHGEEQLSEWSGGRKAKVQHLRKHTNTCHHWLSSLLSGCSLCKSWALRANCIWELFFQSAGWLGKLIGKCFHFLIKQIVM